MALDPMEERQEPQKTYVPQEDGPVPTSARRIRANLGNIEDLEVSLPNPHDLIGKTLSFVAGVNDENEGETGSVSVKGEHFEKVLDVGGDALLLQSDGARWFVVSETDGSSGTKQRSSKQRERKGSRTRTGESTE